MTNEGRPTEHKKKRGRSPSYPGIDLDDALKRARTLYDAEVEHSADVETILSHWEYEPKSSGGYQLLAALKKFGLLNDEGSGANRTARLTRNAVEILLDDREDSSDRQQLIQEAALKPPIHAELWKEYGASLPSDKNLKHKLRFNKGFTDRGVAEFIPQFRRTLAFAKLTGSGMLSDDEEDKPSEETEGFMRPSTKLEGAQAAATGQLQTRVIQLPIAPGEWAALQAPFPLTEEKWKQMLDLLTAMKPGLVTENGAEANEE